jgi:hypothetical protein
LLLVLFNLDGCHGRHSGTYCGYNTFLFENG